MSTLEPSAPDVFEAVYYSWPVPRTLAALTMLGLVFDRVYFPGVYMPPPVFDEKGVADEIRRIASLDRADPSAIQLLQCMCFAMHFKYLDFCIFPGKPGMIETFEPQVHEVVNQLEEMVFGPRPEGEIPIHTGPWVKGLAGDDRSVCQVSAPDTITYPANALLFAGNNGLPLINDVEGLPVPGVPGDPKANAKLLATILAIESVKLMLPNVRPLRPELLKEFRQELAPHLRPFRTSMLKLAKELNSSIQAGSSVDEVRKQAKFLVETDVYPRLVELKVALEQPEKPWYRRAVDLVKDAPELAASFVTLPLNLALAKVFAKFATVLADARDEQREKDQLVKSGLY